MESETNELQDEFVICSDVAEDGSASGDQSERRLCDRGVKSARPALRLRGDRVPPGGTAGKTHSLESDQPGFSA